jgi:hypothetical protein
MEATLQRIRAARAAAHALQPLWITEVGESTSAGVPGPLGVSPAQQAADLLTMIHQAQADGDIPIMLIHTLADAPVSLMTPNDSINTGFGIFTETGTPKPAACALSQLFGGSLRC